MPATRSAPSAIPGCGTPETTYDDVQGNAFYCLDGDFMAYDDAELLPQLVQQLGQSAVAVVMAHEFGHAVQVRPGELGSQYPRSSTSNRPTASPAPGLRTSPAARAT